MKKGLTTPFGGIRRAACTLLRTDAWLCRRPLFPRTLLLLLCLFRQSEAQPAGWAFLIPLRHSSSPQKVTLGSPVRLQWLVKPPRSSRRLAVATNFLRICALRRWRFILSHPYNKKSIVRVSVRCSFFIPSARELESFRFRMPTGGPTKGRGLLHNV